MRYCPTCETKFEEDKILFCTKDGTPLLEGSEPTFTDSLPSDSVPDKDDIGEETVIRRNRPVVENVPDQPGEDDEETGSSRIVIDTASAKAAPPQPQRPAAAAAIPPPPQHTGPSTGLVVFFSVLGTLIVVIGLFTIYLLLTMRSAGDANLNANEDLNVNENIEENFNANELLNLNSNINANTETPTPTPTPSPSPSPSPDANANTNVSDGANTNTATPPPTTPTPQPTVTATPPPASPPANVNRPVNVGTINSRAIALPLPTYPSEAKQVRASGRVVVDVTLDSEGRVVDARATAGHPLLRRSAENAARRSRFEPVSVNGNRVPAKGTILYNFID